ncbi:MAG: HAD family hydrolase [Spirochaetia bacterium]
MTHTAILFDLDGTLLNSLDDLADSMNIVLTTLGFPIHPVDAYRYFVGNGIPTLVRRCLPKSALANEPLVKDAETGMREEYGLRKNNKTHLYDGIPEMLDELQSRGVRLAILSNKPHDALVGVVNHYLSQWKFEAAFGERPGVPNKPNPESAMSIARQMNVPPSAFLYLGDTNTDMETAVAAKMFPVGVTWGFRTAEEITEAGARVLIAKPSEVMGLL